MRGEFDNDGLRTGTITDDSGIIETYVNRRLAHTGLLNFDPYSIPALKPPARFEGQPERIVSNEEGIWKGYFDDEGLLVYGKMELHDIDEIRRGTFNQEGQLHGLGEVEHPNGGKSSGFFLEGVHHSGRVYFPGGSIEIGPRKDYELSGMDCSKTENGLTYRGEYTAGVFKRGQIHYTDSFAIAFPLEEATPHYAKLESDGTYSYVVNDVKVYGGVSVSPGNQELLNMEQTPLLVDPKLLDLYVKFEPMRKQVFHQAFDDFFETVKRRAPLGNDIAAKVLGPRLVKGTCVDFATSNWHTMLEKLSRLSLDEVEKFKFFIVGKLVDADTESSYRHLCVTSSEKMMSQDVSVLTGQRALSRIDDPFQENSAFHSPLVFSLFLDSLNKELNVHLPHIQTVPVCEFIFEGANTMSSAFFIANKPQFDVVLDAFFPGQKLSLTEVVEYDRIILNNHLMPLMKFLYQVSSIASKYYDTTQPPTPITPNKNNFVLVSPNAPPEAAKAIKDWIKAAASAYKGGEDNLRAALLELNTRLVMGEKGRTPTLLSYSPYPN